MVAMVHDDGSRVEIDYDSKNDQTQWETFDPDGNQTGGGQRGGNKVDEVEKEFEEGGFQREGHS